MKKKIVKKAQAKAAGKPASKPAKKPVAKAVASKPVKKAAPAGKAAKKPAPVKAKAPVKVAAKKPATPAPKKVAAAPAAGKKAVPAKEVKETKKGAPIPPEKVEKAPKKEAKAAGKKGRGKKEEEDMDDDFVSDDDIGHDEIGEYEEELKAVESLDEESEEVVEWSQEAKAKGDEEVYLTDAEGRRYCRARDCDQAAVVDTYCRYHYLLFWKKIQVRKRILLDGKLERYIEELTSRYPDKFLEMIRRDLRTEKDFVAAIQELEIDESGLDNEMEEDTQSYIEEVRGMGEGSGNGVEDEEF